VLSWRRQHLISVAVETSGDNQQQHWSLEVVKGHTATAAVKRVIRHTAIIALIDPLSKKPTST